MLLLACALLAACSLPGEPGSGGPNAWIDAPLDGSTLVLNSPYTVVSHASAAAGIDSVELSINGAVLGTDGVAIPGQAYVLMKQPWTPAQPGSYDVRVRARASDGTWSGYALAHVVVGGTAPFPPAASPTSTPPPSDTPLPAATAVPTLTATLTPPPSATPLPAPVFTLTVNANCRSGPDSSFAVLTVLPSGSTANIQGRLADSSWFLVASSRLNANCWVSAQTGQPSGPVDGVPVLVSPPTPTPALPVIGAPTLSGTSIYAIRGCGAPESITFTFAISNASAATLYYQPGGGGWNSLPMAQSGGNWSATLHDGGVLTGYSGPLSYYAVATNGGSSVQSPTYSDITVMNCKP